MTDTTKEKVPALALVAWSQWNKWSVTEKYACCQFIRAVISQYKLASHQNWFSGFLEQIYTHTGCRSPFWEVSPSYSMNSHHDTTCTVYHMTMCRCHTDSSCPVLFMKYVTRSDCSHISLVVWQQTYKQTKNKMNTWGRKLVYMSTCCRWKFVTALTALFVFCMV